MKNKILIILIILLIGLASLVFGGQKSINTSQDQIISPTSTIENSKVYEEKENSEGEVTVTVKPLKLARYNSAPDGKENTVFEVTMETHTVELDKDLKNVSVLVDEKGTEYKPTNWTGGQGGHHISGDLIFPPVSKDAKFVILTIKEIDNIDRKFSWNL